MARSIVIVGNGSFADADALVIDSCDLVIRFNDCRSVGDGGKRTDVVAVCNTGRPAAAMIGQPAWRNNSAVKNAGTILCVREGTKFAELKQQLAIQHPSLDDFCDDYTGEFADFALNNGKNFTVIPRRFHDHTDLELRTLTPGSYIVPSSGLITIAYVVGEVAGPDDTVLLSGFSHRGWNGHPFDAERKLVERLIDQGHVRRL
ncbi:Urease operon accessory protein [Ensifer adhaerens]|uniref:Urease operon accessory protein n=1 Tax=Ensifer adhaerens TaxID=106592 RepID=UPI001C4DDD5B|nr:Urease operon accessory protein [Ensifer adhaerens]MBW0371389.1 Urease operon accessory protein [Ensifer adhaerens]UCM24405.1 Urease operon accessory protein [Ensifer adhaerens]